MLNANPPRRPGKDFFVRFINSLIKWDDRYNRARRVPKKREKASFYSRGVSVCYPQSLILSHLLRTTLMGVLTLADEYGIEFEPEFKAKIDDYMKDADLRACFSPGL